MSNLTISRAAFVVVVGLVASCDGTSAIADRVTTRGAISGRVVLVDVDGLNDLSRVRIDVGNGEGGVAVGDDGVFVAVDLEPDVYDLTVTYSGGLTPEASGSAYRTFTRRVPLPAGGAVDVGDLALQPATGRVTGRVGFTDADGADLATGDDAVVQLVLNDGGALETTPAADGSFAFDDVPVGFHALRVDAAGFATPASSTDACGRDVIVAEADAVVDIGGIGLVQGRATLLPGDGELFSSPTATTWTLAPGRSLLTVRVLSGHARAARAWLDDPQNPPAFVDDDTADGNVELVVPVSPGAHRMFVQTFDGCRFTSSVLEKNLLRDESAPAVLDVFVPGALVGDTGAVLVRPANGTIPVVVDVVDDLGEVDAVAVTVIDGDDDPAGIAPSTLTFVPVVATGLVRVALAALLPAGDGHRFVVALARDTSGNLSLPLAASPAVAPLVVDTTPPAIVSVTLDDGRTVTRNPTAVLRVVAGDAGSGTRQMQVTTTDAFDLPAVPFSGVVVVDLNPARGDGERVVLVRVADGVGNTAEASATVQLDTTPPTGTSVVLAGGAATTTRRDVAVELRYAAAGDGRAAAVAVAEGAIDCTTAERRPLDGVSPDDTTISLAAGDGPRTVVACFFDEAGNAVTASDSVVLDTILPTASIAVQPSGTSAATTRLTTDVPVTLSGVSADAVAAAIVDVTAGSPQTCAVATYGPVAGPRVLAAFATSVEEPKTVGVCLRDAAGNQTAVPASTSSIVLDRSLSTATTTAALVGTRRDGVSSTVVTRTTAVTLTFAGVPDDVVEVAIADNAAFLGAAVDAFANGASYPVTLLPGDGGKSVFVRLTDGAGNTATLQDNIPAGTDLSIVLDTTPPAAPVVVIAGGASFATTNAGVPVALSAQTVGTADGGLQVRVSSNDPDFADDGEGFVDVFPTTATFPVGDGSRTLFAVFRDEAGNETTVASDSVIVDVTPPGAPVVRLNGGAAFTNSVSVTATLSGPVLTASPFANAVEMQVAVDGTPDDEPYTPLATTFTVLLPATGPAEKTVAVRLRDAAGLTSVAPHGTARITLDTTPPTTPILAVTSVVTRDPNFTIPLLVSANDDNLLRHEFVDGVGVTSFAQPEAVVTDGQVRLQLAAERAHLVRVRGVDRAGNVSAEAVATVTFDVTAPTPPVVLHEEAPVTVNADNFTVTLAREATDENLAGYRVVVNGVDQGLAAAGSRTVALTADTTAVIEVFAVDRAGNVSIPTATARGRVTVIEDSRPPQRVELEPLPAFVLGGMPVDIGQVNGVGPVIFGPPSVDVFLARSESSVVTTHDPNFDHYEVRTSHPSFENFVPVCLTATPLCQPQFINADNLVLNASDIAITDNETIVGFRVPILPGAANEIELRGVDRAGNVGAAGFTRTIDASVQSIPKAKLGTGFPGTEFGSEYSLASLFGDLLVHEQRPPPPCSSFGLLAIRKAGQDNLFGTPDDLEFGGGGPFSLPGFFFTTPKVRCSDNPLDSPFPRSRSIAMAGGLFLTSSDTGTLFLCCDNADCAVLGGAPAVERSVQERRCFEVGVGFDAKIHETAIVWRQEISPGRTAVILRETGADRAYDADDQTARISAAAGTCSNCTDFTPRVFGRDVAFLRCPGAANSCPSPNAFQLFVAHADPTEGFLRTDGTSSATVDLLPQAVAIDPVGLALYAPEREGRSACHSNIAYVANGGLQVISAGPDRRFTEIDQVVDIVGPSTGIGRVQGCRSRPEHVRVRASIG